MRLRVEAKLQFDLVCCQRILGSASRVSHTMLESGSTLGFHAEDTGELVGETIGCLFVRVTVDQCRKGKSFRIVHRVIVEIAGRHTKPSSTKQCRSHSERPAEFCVVTRLGCRLALDRLGDGSKHGRRQT